MIIFLTGAGGQGKTTTSKFFLKKKGYKVHLNKDHEIIDSFDLEKKRYSNIEIYLDYKKKAWSKFKKELYESFSEKNKIHIFDTCPYLYKAAIIRRVSGIKTKHVEKKIIKLISDIDKTIKELKKYNYIIFLFPYNRVKKIEDDSYRSPDLMSHIALFRIIHSLLIEEKIKFYLVEKMDIKKTYSFISNKIKNKIIFCDIDGTLIHKEKKFDCFKIPNEKNYFCKTNLKLIKMIMKKDIKFNLITGRRVTNYKKIKLIIPHNEAYIEHGSVLINQRGEIEFCLNNKLNEFSDFLKNKNYIIDNKDRMMSLRVLNPDKKLILKKFMKHKVKKIYNENRIDFIPSNEGKEKVIEKLKNKNNLIYAIGNDLNDIEMLKKADKSFCLNDSHNKVKKIVVEKGGYVSPYNSHIGTNDILNKIYLEI